jgi:hypothetical protein
VSDYRPEVYGLVEGSWRTAPPPPDVVDHALSIECPDCNVNVFVEESPDADGVFLVKVAHDETCPWLTRREAEGA